MNKNIYLPFIHTTKIDSKSTVIFSSKDGCMGKINVPHITKTEYSA